MSKTPKPKIYKFKIDVFTPDTMPMARLAEYMASLAKLLGEPRMVHFVELKEGSTVIVHKVDTEAVPKIQERIERIKRGDATNEETRPYKTLNEMLRADNCVALLSGGGKGKVLRFQGRDEAVPVTYGTISHEGTIDGVPMWVGGITETAHVTVVEEGREFNCQTNKAIAREIGKHLYESQLRLFGKGRWRRDPNGEWNLESFRITSFLPLKKALLSEVVSELRAVEGSEWPTVENPWEELHKLRHGENGEK